jgi:dGTPase
MLRREESEKREYTILSEFAAKAAESAGRATPEAKCEFRTDFQRDRDRVIHSKALRRLMHKTQVFLSPEGDHYRTRLTHTLEVAQISRSIARGLRLNEDLTEAIAMAHDLGHTPFGHNGEFFLNEKHPGGFKHNIQSLRVVDVLESSGDRRGMNLTEEVRDGIANHTGSKVPSTLEGQVVKISDRVAYINHDIDDALRSGVIAESDLPPSAVKILGDRTNIRIDTLVRDMIITSDGRDSISLSDNCAVAINELRTYMFANVYKSEKVKRSEELDKIRFLISSLYDHYLENPDDLPEEYQALIGEFGKAEMVKDQIAGMTDRYAIDTFEKLFVPTGWKHDF